MTFAYVKEGEQLPEQVGWLPYGEIVMQPEGLINGLREVTYVIETNA